MKFRIGDRVIEEGQAPHWGPGVIVFIDHGDTILPYKVMLTGGLPFWYKEKELVLVESGLDRAIKRIHDHT